LTRSDKIVKALEIDFSGNGYPDLLCIVENSYFIVINHKEPDYFKYGNRNSLIPQTELSQDFYSKKYAIMPPLSIQEGSSQNDSLVLVADGGKMEVIRYLNDSEVFIWNRYLVFPYTLIPRESDPVNLFSRIFHIGFGEFTKYSKYRKNDLFLVTYDGIQYRLILFKKPFQDLDRSARNISPTLIFDLPANPSRLWFGDIEKDEKHKDDIFFEYEENRAWHIWIADPSLDQYSHSFQYPVPEGALQVQDILSIQAEYDLLVSVKSQPESDIAYVAFKKESIPLDQEIYIFVPVTIPGKHLQGAVTRLFSYENKNTGESYPIAMVYNQLDPQNPQPNPISIYRIDPVNPLSPQLVQTFIPEYIIGDELFYFDRPEVVADFDQDGISDLMLMALPAQPDTNVIGRPLGFTGISSNTKIPEWSLYEPR